MVSHYDNKTAIYFDEGMSDAMCRMMLGEKETATLAGKTHDFVAQGARKAAGGAGRSADTNDIVEVEPVQPQQYAVAAARLGQCVVGLLDRWNDTLAVLNHWFPWIDTTNDPYRRRYYLYSNKETRQTARKDLYSMVVKHNACDMMLHAQLLAQFEKQIAIAQSSFFL